MGKFCSKCGSKVEGNFCTNCGTKITEKAETVKIISNDVNDYLKDKVRAKRDHSTYRLVLGIIMIVLGFCVFIVSLNEESVLKYEMLGYNVTLGFMLPGLAILAGGILSIISRNNNKLLLISGICYVVAAICNVCGIQDISILFILCCIFAPMNFVFYTKTNKYEQE